MKTSKLTVVLDTNVLLVSLPPRSPYYPIFASLVAGMYDLAISNEILAEYEEQISVRYDSQTVRYLLGVLGALPNARRVNPYYHWQLIVRDPDDDKFADAAVAANADLLVTNDRHFDVLRTVGFPKVTIATAQSFRDLLTLAPNSPASPAP
jgi:putative PIN family toxin of toxin-antitoxin system